MNCNHKLFFGNYPTEPEIYLSNQEAIEKRVKGNYRVRCGHCGTTIHGQIWDSTPVIELEWRHDANTFFGTFKIKDYG